jgi:uncharacterized membrane protein HdeD (DUF308 family)
MNAAAFIPCRDRGIIRAVLPGILWFALLTAAGLCYPRRPRTAGMLWIMLGVLSLILNLQHGPARWLAQVPGILWIVLGIWYLVKYMNPEVRSKHVEYWTAKA